MASLDNLGRRLPKDLSGLTGRFHFPGSL
jgi:hypothetical protein